MANFAKIGLNNKVIGVVTICSNELLDAENNEQEINGINFLNQLTGYPIWKQTSYNTYGGVHSSSGTPLRKNYAGVGYTYDEDRDAFIPQKPFNSWVLNESTCLWEAPVAMPIDENKYTWNESTLTWDIVEL